MGTSTFPRIFTPAGPVPVDAPVWNRQRHSAMPSHRYRDVYSRVEVPLAQRNWPTQRLTAAPLWVPVDLRDGNQALAEPMDPGRKRRFFELMVAMGYKEIEVGYPSASQTDFDFVRLIVETDIAPPEVTIVVFTPARRDLIERTVESVRGVRNEVVVHMYTATAPTWREVVLDRDRTALTELIVAGGRDVLELAGDLPNVRFEFSPEVFNLTEPDYALEVCDAITELWDATPERPVIVNLPATVEIATPNVYADQIEYMHTNLARRDAVILSVHPHNDRGTGIACAELAVLAGAQRVEGCVFGNGERTGNVDIATLALNLHAQGIDPMIDPADIGRTYDAVIRVNSQSGKGGVAYLLESEYGIEIPRRLQIDFTRHVQDHTDTSGGEVTATELWEIFDAAYLARPDVPGAPVLRAFDVTDAGTTIMLGVGGTEHRSVHEGVCPVEASTDALARLGIDIEVLGLHQSSVGTDALTLIEFRSGDDTRWAAGRHSSVLTASLHAVVRAAACIPRPLRTVGSPRSV
ncbi:2-isopropylmalate synthase [Rhodococcus pyridinivorans]